jgi:hypothetical protein
VAELEAGLISERTKAGLAIAKQRGVKLGTTGAEILAPKYRAEAKARAERMPVRMNRPIATVAETGDAAHRATPDATAALEAEINGLRQIGELLRRELDEVQGA